MCPAPRFRQAKARVRKSPGGKKVLKYKAEKNAKATCALCEAKLNAVPNKSTGQMAKLSKTQKRPQRAFGGVLCSSCTHQIIKEKARLTKGEITEKDVDFNHFKYLAGYKIK